MSGTAIAVAAIVATSPKHQSLGPAVWFLFMVVAMIPYFFAVSAEHGRYMKEATVAYVLFGIALFVMIIAVPWGAFIEWRTAVQNWSEFDLQHAKLFTFLSIGSLIVVWCMASLVYQLRRSDN